MRLLQFQRDLLRRQEDSRREIDALLTAGPKGQGVRAAGDLEAALQDLNDEVTDLTQEFEKAKGNLEQARERATAGAGFEERGRQIDQLSGPQPLGGDYVPGAVNQSPNLRQGTFVQGGGALNGQGGPSLPIEVIPVTPSGQPIPFSQQVDALSPGQQNLNIAPVPGQGVSSAGVASLSGSVSEAVAAVVGVDARLKSLTDALPRLQRDEANKTLARLLNPVIESAASAEREATAASERSGFLRAGFSPEDADRLQTAQQRFRDLEEALAPLAPVFEKIEGGGELLADALKLFAETAAEEAKAFEDAQRAREQEATDRTIGGLENSLRDAQRASGIGFGGVDPSFTRDLVAANPNISQEDAQIAQDLQSRYERVLAAQQGIRDAAEGTAAALSDAGTRGLADLITGARTLKDIFSELLASIGDIFLNIAANQAQVGLTQLLQPLASSLFSGAGAGVGGAATAGLGLRQPGAVVLPDAFSLGLSSRPRQRRPGPWRQALHRR